MSNFRPEQELNDVPVMLGVTPVVEAGESTADPNWKPTQELDETIPTMLGVTQVEGDLGSRVVANPTPTGSEGDLGYIEIDGTKYKVTGAGGTTVIPNPEVSAPVDDLSTVKISGVDYHVSDFQKDGSYPDLTSGNADQLTTKISVTDKEPYLYRTSGGSLEIGDRAYIDSIVGGTVAWNQMVQNGNFASVAYWDSLVGASLSVSDNIGKVTATSTSSQGFAQSVTFPLGHKVFGCLTVKAQTSGHKFGMSADYSTLTKNSIVSLDTEMPTTWKTFAGICNITDVSNVGTRIAMPNPTNMNVNDYFEVKNVMAIDLTQLFGSTIADYLYTLEQGTVGAGVSILYDYFPKLNGGYYAYDSGSLKSVKTSAHKTTGFNQLDAETVMHELGFTKQSDGSWYVATASSVSGKVIWQNDCNYEGRVNIKFDYKYESSTYSGVRFKFNYADGTSNTPSLGNYTTFTHKLLKSESGKKVVSITTDYGSNLKSWFKDLCVQLAWDDSEDDRYEDFDGHTYPIEDRELRGIFKLDGNNKIYCDGDVMHSGGGTDVKYGIVDLGTLEWYKTTIGSDDVFGVAFTTHSHDSSTINIICSKYVANNNVYSSVGKVEKTIMNNYAGSVLGVYDTGYADAEAFKTAMSGVYLVYELATPTTASTDPFTTPQIVSNWGTEQFVDTRDVAIPVGHNTTYPVDLKAKLETAPNLPENDGLYLLKMEGGIASYVVSLPELPTNPSEDGTYTLKATTSSGTTTLSWVADETPIESQGEE